MTQSIRVRSRIVLSTISALCLALSLALLASCVSGDVDLVADDEDVGSVQGAGWAGNGLSPDAFVNAISANQMALSKLASMPLTDALNDPFIQLQLHDRDAVEFMTYMVQCAMPPTVTMSLVDGYRGVTVATVQGRHNLAAPWQTAPPNQAMLERVSGCMLARVNAWGTTVLISMRGEPKGLFPVGAFELAAMPVEEGSFYGNIFLPGQLASNVLVYVDPSSGEVIEHLPMNTPVRLYRQMWACHDPAFSLAAGYMERRVCAIKACVAQPVGECPSVCLLEDGTARLGDGDNQDCADLAGKVWLRPVTTFLKDCNSANPMLPSCL